MTSDATTIRLARPHDLDALLPLVTAYRAFYKQVADEVRERAFVAGHLQRGSSTILVAESRGAIVGFAQLFPTYSTVHLGTVWLVEDLYVAQQARGVGVATALLARAVERARAAGATGMFLETARDNQAARSLYERAGWLHEETFLKFNAPL